MRVTGAYTRDNVRRELPRVRDEDLWACFGALPDAPVRWELLREATAAAIGTPELINRSREGAAALAAAVIVAGRAFGRGELAALLECSDRTIGCLRARTPDRALVIAIERQLELRSRLAAREEAAPRHSGPR